MRIADYVMHFFADRGIRHLFLVTGGGAMFLNDALNREPRLRYVCNLHEQACAMAAEGYARVSGMPGLLCVTSGPGGTNALTGVAGAWLDSIPMVVLSGQVKRQTTVGACPELGLRQLGDQELNIIDVVRPITKYAVQIREPEQVSFALEKAWHLCRTGRPGPVWLDVPLDVQSAEFDPAVQKHFMPEPPLPGPAPEALASLCENLKSARRPVIVAGIGVRQSGMVAALTELAERCRIPVLTAISGTDLLPSEHPLVFGRPGIMGQRAANFILQNSDLLLVLGTRMGLRTIGYAWESVARGAFKIMVDADAAELQKPTFRSDLPIHADLKDFFCGLFPILPEVPDRKAWLDYCSRLKQAYPLVSDAQRQRRDFVSSYVLPELISKHCRQDAIVVTGNGTAYTSTFQAMPVKPGMRLFANCACASMGYGLPAAIGAALAGEGREVICLTGDGSLQMNLQELQTLKNLHLPVKLFVYNNEGYLSIKNTQKAFFGGHFVGSEAGSGVILPDLRRLAEAYGLPFFRLNNNQEAAALLPEILRLAGPVIIEVLLDPMEELGPKSASKPLPGGKIVSAPLEDMAPFLPREEFQRNMIVPPVKEEF